MDEIGILNIKQQANVNLNGWREQDKNRSEGVKFEHNNNKVMKQVEGATNFMIG